MDDLRTILDQLEDAKLDYVYERSKTRTDAEGIRAAGVSRSTFYKWADREKLNELAQELKRRRKMLAELVIEEAAEKAARVKVEGLESRKEHIKQDAASEILDRTIGKPSQHLEHTGKDGQEIIINLSWDINEKV